MKQLLLEAGVIEHHLVGSMATCDPPPIDTDEDYIMLVRNTQQAIDRFIQAGYELESEIYVHEDDESISISEFVSLRHGKTNLIIAKNISFFRKFLIATDLAKRFNLMDKKDRIDLFQAILYGEGKGAMA